MEFFYDLEIIELVELFKKDFVLVLLICFVIAAVYDMESRSDISIIIRSLPEGRQKFQKNKIVTAMVFAIITTVLFCGIDIAIYGYKYSFENWGRTVHRDVFDSVYRSHFFCASYAYLVMWNMLLYTDPGILRAGIFSPITPIIHFFHLIYI